MRDELPAVRHSDTSRAAARSARGEANRYRAMILDHLRLVGAAGATDEEMQERLGVQPNTQRPRRVELVAAGLVENSGNTRETRAGRQACVWVYCGPAGKAGAE